MTTAAAASFAARATGPLSRWLSVRHPLRTEATAVLSLYGLYEVARGLASATAPKPSATRFASPRQSALCTSSSRSSCRAPFMCSPA
jgi:hypothetical protein